jgi:hypothetical protein
MHQTRYTSSPTAGTVTQPTCATATGSAQITGYTVTNNYTHNTKCGKYSGKWFATASSGTYTLQ